MFAAGAGAIRRQTPNELQNYSLGTGLDGDSLARISRLTARVDNNAIADGFQLYLHGFVVSSAGEWTIVQQGMNGVEALARRYHWHSATVQDFTVQPHSAIVGDNQGTIMNLVDAQSIPAQQALLRVVQQRPEATLQTIRRLNMPPHHDFALRMSTSAAWELCWPWPTNANFATSLRCYCWKNLGRVRYSR